AQLIAQPGGAAEEAVGRELAEDSCKQYFRGKKRTETHREKSQPSMPATKKAYRVTGTRTPDHRTRAVELTMLAKEVLALTRSEDISLTMYLTALFFESIRRSSGGMGKSRTLAATVPVNLRQFFPSVSPRNFFATV